MNDGTVDLVPAFERREELIPLYREYADLVVKADPVFAKSLAQQHYDEEIANLEEKYGLPKGRIYLLYVDGRLAGCVGMKPSEPADRYAELKRLYVRPEFRGHNLGERMVRRIMEDARDEGYSFLRLDTLPELKSALRLYNRLGFHPVEAYYDCLVPGTIFMEIAL